MFFDSHCHLTDETLSSQYEAVLERARVAQVSQILSVAVNLDDAEAILKIADGKFVLGSAGIHPQNALSWNENSDARLRELVKAEHVVALGEIGLDYLYDDTHPRFPGATRARQEEIFEFQLQIAADTQKPIIIHNRDADERLLQIVGAWREKLMGGVFHCFGSTPEIARRVLDLDFHLGFTGIVTFKNAPEVQEVARICPLERILIETDAPYLAPTPHRGKTNEPSFVPHVAAKIAELKELSIEEIGAITSANAQRLFGLNSSMPH